jgi:anti-sigma regulatory factor (Ser/Thr protein kinase)
MARLYGSGVQRHHHIRDSSAIGSARRDALRLASLASMDEAATGRLGVVVTELATNLLRHAQGGELFLQGIPGGARSAVEVLALDRGPGMADVEKCLRDGYSSSGTTGNGLGAVRRLASEFDLASSPGKGTVVMARIGASPTERFGAISTAVEGETECGDAWRMAFSDDAGGALMLVDGLGHGASAAAAARLATESFSGRPFDPPQTQLERSHGALTGSRGAAAACAAWNMRSLRYAGIGNITGRLSAHDSNRGLVSHNGTLGFQIRRIQQFEYPLSSGNLLIMHSDGLSARWDLGDYFGPPQRHPALIAGMLYRDYLRGKDDATVVVVGL